MVALGAVVSTYHLYLGQASAKVVCAFTVSLSDVRLRKICTASKNLTEAAGISQGYSTVEGESNLIVIIIDRTLADMSLLPHFVAFSANTLLCQPRWRLAEDHETRLDRIKR